MVLGASSPRYARWLEPLPDEVEVRAVSKRAVSERFVVGTERKPAELMRRDVSGLMLVVLMIDGAGFGEHVMLVAAGIDQSGSKQVLGLRQGATEKAAAVRALLSYLHEHKRHNVTDRAARADARFGAPGGESSVCGARRQACPAHARGVSRVSEISISPCSCADTFEGRKRSNHGGFATVTLKADARECSGPLQHGVDMESGSSPRVCDRRNGEQRLKDVAQAVIGLLRNGKLVSAFVRGCNLLSVLESGQMEIIA